MGVGTTFTPLTQGAAFLWSSWDDGVNVVMLKPSVIGRSTKTGTETVAARILFICYRTPFKAWLP